jgi:hypothetical protein
MRTLRLAIILAAVLCLSVPATSQAAKRCAVSTGDWHRSTPEQAGMDAARPTSQRLRYRDAAKRSRKGF